MIRRFLIVAARKRGAATIREPLIADLFSSQCLPFTHLLLQQLPNRRHSLL
jgi:hypothetical protein